MADSKRNKGKDVAEDGFEGEVVEDVETDADQAGDADAAKAEQEAKTARKEAEAAARAERERKRAERKAKTAAKGSKSKRRSRGRGKGRRCSRIVLTVVLAVVCLAAGIVLDHFVLRGVFANSSSLQDQTTVSESGLDTVIASYTYDGTAHDIKIREVIEENSTLDNAKNDDGTYDIPSADDVLTYARTQILDQAVEDKGITVSDDEVDAYAEQYLGTSDYDTIASNWGLDADTAKKTIKESCALSKLRDEVAGTLSVTMPSAPTEAADGQEDVATADYGAYVVGLLGDEWDTTNETWARTDGPYYQALSDQTFSSNSATYNQALLAYQVAYTQYTQAYSEQSQKWTDYVGGLLSNATIEIYTLGV